MAQATQDSSQYQNKIQAATTQLRVTDANLTAPHHTNTLIDVLRWHIEQHAERPHLRFCGNPDSRAVSFQQLYDNAKQVAAGLQQLDIKPGESVRTYLIIA